MTDEQVQRIVDALASNPWEPWISAVVALVSALLGFLLSQAAESSRRKQQMAGERAAARRAAALDAIAFTIETSASPAALIRERSKALPEALSKRIASLRVADDSYEVGEWWVRQMAIIGMPPAGREEFTTTEGMYRNFVTLSVSTRLEAWADGTLSAAEFAAEHDAAWDRRMHVPPAPTEN